MRNDLKRIFEFVSFLFTIFSFWDIVDFVFNIRSKLGAIDKRRYKIRREFETVKNFNVCIWIKIGLLGPGHIYMAMQVRCHGNKPQNINKDFKLDDSFG